MGGSQYGPLFSCSADDLLEFVFGSSTCIWGRGILDPAPGKIALIVPPELRWMVSTSAWQKGGDICSVDGSQEDSHTSIEVRGGGVANRGRVSEESVIEGVQPLFSKRGVHAEAEIDLRGSRLSADVVGKE